MRGGRRTACAAVIKDPSVVRDVEGRGGIGTTAVKGDILTHADQCSWPRFGHRGHCRWALARRVARDAGREVARACAVRDELHGDAARRVHVRGRGDQSLQLAAGVLAEWGGGSVITVPKENPVQGIGALGAQGEEDPVQGDGVTRNIRTNGDGEIFVIAIVTSGSSCIL